MEFIAHRTFEIKEEDATYEDDEEEEYDEDWV